MGVEGSLGSHRDDKDHPRSRPPLQTSHAPTLCVPIHTYAHPHRRCGRSWPAWASARLTTWWAVRTCWRWTLRWWPPAPRWACFCCIESSRVCVGVGACVCAFVRACARSRSGFCAPRQSCGKGCRFAAACGNHLSRPTCSPVSSTAGEHHGQPAPSWPPPNLWRLHLLLLPAHTLPIMLLAPLLPSPAKTHSPYPHPRPAQTQTQALNPHCCCTFTQRQFYPQTHVLPHAPHRAAGGHRPVQPAAARGQPAAGRGAALRVQAGPRPGPGPGWWVVVELVGMAVVEGHGWGWRFGWRSAARCLNRTTA